MKSVVSISRRTDIPKWYSHWLLKGLHSSEVTYIRPGDRKPISLPLNPEKVHSIVLWSKDYSRLLSNQELLSALSLYNLYFHFTITGLGNSPVEPRVPPPSLAIQQMKQLARLFNVEQINWRFDPILYWIDERGLHSNLEFFPKLAEQVAQIGIKRCTFSFATWYKKCRFRTKRQDLTFIEPDEEEKLLAIYSLVEVASLYNISLFSCAQDEWLKVKGINKSRCIDGELLAKLHPQGEPAPLDKDKSQRKECGCTTSIDIGSYSQTCFSGCRYCYANPCLR